MGVFWCPHMDHILEGFFPSILWCSWSGNDPKDDLASFGYILDTKTRKKTKILLYLLLPTGTYCKNMMILNFFSFEIWWIWVHFLMKNPLYGSKSFFSSLHLAKFRKERKNKTKFHFKVWVGNEKYFQSFGKALNNP